MQSWSFPSETLVRIGRSSDNDVVVYSAVVSRHHVELKLTPSGWEISSLGANGTYINQERVATVKAADGMVMRLGSTGPKIQISLDPSALPLSGTIITPKKTHPNQTPTSTDRVKTFLTEPKTATTPAQETDEEDDDDTTQFPT